MTLEIFLHFYSIVSLFDMIVWLYAVVCLVGMGMGIENTNYKGKFESNKQKYIKKNLKLGMGKLIFQNKHQNS